MQIVVDVPEDMYKDAKARNTGRYSMYDFSSVVANGTPLPKGHGRLKDVDAFISKVKTDRKHSAYSRSWAADDVLTALDNSYAPTIIETDKEVENADSN